MDIPLDIRDRVRLILNREQLSQVEFANRSGIKPATLNHVLTGRNNASQEVLDKILAAFPSYNSEWLLFGRGGILTDEAHQALFRATAPPLFPELVTAETEPQIPSKSPSESSHRSIPETEPASAAPSVVSSRKIAKIIVYYTDNTFETLLPS